VRARPNSRHSPKPDKRRALELLAACHDGCTEAILVAHGFTIANIVELVRAGLASATAKRVIAGSRTMEVATVRITDAGRRWCVLSGIPAGRMGAPAGGELRRRNCFSDYNSVWSTHRAQHRRELPMKTILLAAVALAALISPGVAEIICTQHGGCRETGKRIISGDSGGVTSQQQITSHREAKPKKVRVIRTIYENE
jgi:hypothetical protein